MFKQRPHRAPPFPEAFFASWLLFTVSFFYLTAEPALAKHDPFLLGEGPDVKASDHYLPGEQSMARAPLIQIENQAIFALYVAPLLLGDSDGVSRAHLARRARSALALLPDLAALEKARIKDKTSADLNSSDVLKYSIGDSLRFLRWRLDYFLGEKGAVTRETRAYLAKRNAEATKQGALVCNDLLSLSMNFDRQEYYLDGQNLAQFSHYLTALKSEEIATKADQDAVKEYERHMAQAYTTDQLDRREEALDHFRQGLNYLRARPQAQRPQTDAVRKSLLRLIDQSLFKYENIEATEDQSDKLNRSDAEKAPQIALDASERQQFKKNVDSLIDVAYMAKIDGRLSEAAFLFRRAYLLIMRYLPGEQKDYTALYYDLGETLLWDEKFDDCIFYISKCLELRSKNDPLSVTTVDTSNFLGRARLSQGKANKALHIFFNDLTLVARRIKLKNIDPADAAESEAGRNALLQALLAYCPTGGADERRQIADGMQGIIDAALPLKQYDLALTSGEALLQLRSQAVPTDDGAIMGVLWGLAYTCDGCCKPEQAVKYYSQMLDSFGTTRKTSLPYWYHGRGVDYELVGRHDLAVIDIKKAIALYHNQMKVEKDDGWRDHLKWTAADLQYNLDMAAKYPLTRTDYADLVDNCRWRLASFPLRIFLDESKQRGFGGELNTLAREAVSIWRDFDGSPIKVEYVDKLSKADIYIERVTDYEDIPEGSAGRTSASYERKGDVDTKITTRAHVRVYCPTFDGNSWEGEDVKMSSFAKIQFKYLLVHELGHVFGLGHSPAGPDVMYWKSCAKKLSDRDMNTAKIIYKRTAK